MKSDVQTNSDTEIMLNIARQFSKKLNEGQNDYQDLIIPVKVWHNKSQYVGIKKLMCEHKNLLIEWRDNVTLEPLFRYGIGLGRIIESCKMGKAEDEIFGNQVVEHIIKSPDDTPAILTLVPSRGVSDKELRNNVTTLVLDPLCRLVFKDSFLSKQFENGSKSPRFFYEPYNSVFDNLQKAINKDARFHFGVECERFLFPGQPGFIYSFIDLGKGKDCPGIKHRWALCLWTSKPEKQRLDIVDKLNVFLQEYSQEYSQENVTNERHEAVGKWGVIFDDLTPECKDDVKAAEILKTCNAFVNDEKSDIQRVKNFVNKFKELYEHEKNENDLPTVDIMKKHKDEISGWMTD